MKIPLTAASFVYAAGNEQPQKNELKPGYEMLYYIAQQRDWEAAEIVFAYFLAALESDADKCFSILFTRFFGKLFRFLYCRTKLYHKWDHT